MGSHPWSDLPEQVRDAVELHCGRVTDVQHPSAGRHSDFSAALCTDTGPVFVKGIRADSPYLWMHRNEARVNRFLPELASHLLWEAESAGWLLHGFEHVTGHYANLEPDSPDLPLVAIAVAEMHRTLNPCPAVNVRSFADQWERLSAWQRLRDAPPADLDPWSRDHLATFADFERQAIEFVRGDSLAHTDLHSLNILVGDRARVIDWAWARRAAAWVDVAFLVIRLVDAGHTPQDAENWAASIPAWQDAPDVARSLFAGEVLGIWEHLQHSDPLPHRAQLTNAARAWARHRYTPILESGSDPRSGART